MDDMSTIKTDSDNNFLYSLKTSLITQSEKPYLTAIKKSLPNGYFVQPQINLASIIVKNGDFKYQNELFRNIDACIFDMSYKPIVLIEINDISHNDYRRRDRDTKVKNICEEAGIKLITFWTNYGLNQDYIYKKVNEAINEAPNFTRIKHSDQKDHINKSDQNFTQYNSNVNTYRSKMRKNGCYIATAVYGSYDCENVWVLRRFRDFKLNRTFFGRCFVKIYYTISPHLVKWFGNTIWFKRLCKKLLDAKVSKLKRKGYSDKPYQDLY